MVGNAAADCVENGRQRKGRQLVGTTFVKCQLFGGRRDVPNSLTTKDTKVHEGKNLLIVSFVPLVVDEFGLLSTNSALTPATLASRRISGAGRSSRFFPR